MKSQMACNVARQVSGAYKTLQSQIDKKESEWQLLDFDPTSAPRGMAGRKQRKSVTFVDVLWYENLA